MQLMQLIYFITFSRLNPLIYKNSRLHDFFSCCRRAISWTFYPFSILYRNFVWFARTPHEYKYYSSTTHYLLEFIKRAEAECVCLPLSYLGHFSHDFKNNKHVTFNLSSVINLFQLMINLFLCSKNCKFFF